MKIELIVATDLNGLIGLNGQMPWREPDDLRRFAAITKGHAVMMGHNTWTSLPKKPLTGRMNIVVTSRPEAFNGKATPVNTPMNGIKEALARSYERLFIIGGAELYNWALSSQLVEAVHLTQFNRATIVRAEDKAIYFAPLNTVKGFEITEQYYRLAKSK